LIEATAARQHQASFVTCSRFRNPTPWTRARPGRYHVTQSGEYVWELLFISYQDYVSHHTCCYSTEVSHLGHRSAPLASLESLAPCDGIPPASRPPASRPHPDRVTCNFGRRSPCITVSLQIRVTRERRGLNSSSMNSPSPVNSSSIDEGEVCQSRSDVPR
jgi:hypothetical protein